MDSARIVMVGILRAAGDETAAIDDEQILDVVALVPLVQHARLRIVAHAARAELVDAIARRKHLVGPVEHFEAGLWQTSPSDSTASFAMLNSLSVYLHWKFSTGNAPRVHDILVDAHVILVARQALRPSAWPRSRRPRAMSSSFCSSSPHDGKYRASGVPPRGEVERSIRG